MTYQEQQEKNLLDALKSENPVIKGDGLDAMLACVSYKKPLNLDAIKARSYKKYLKFYDPIREILTAEGYIQTLKVLLAINQDENASIEEKLIEGTPEDKEIKRNLNRLNNPSKIINATNGHKYSGVYYQGRPIELMDGEIVEAQEVLTQLSMAAIRVHIQQNQNEDLYDRDMDPNH